MRIIEIVSKGNMAGAAINNRWHVLLDPAAADPLAMLALFRTNVLVPMVSALHTSFQWTDLAYCDVYPTIGLLKDYSTSFPVVGTNASTVAPTFVAAGVKWVLGDTVHLDADPLTKHIKRGSKRIGGICDGDVNGQIWAPGPSRTAILTGLGNFWGGTLGSSLAVVVHFPPSPPPVPPAVTSPRLPVVRYAPIVGQAARTNIGSQVSRKLGHGT